MTLEEAKSAVSGLCREQAARWREAAMEVYEAAELNWREGRSAEALCRMLEEAGFSVERGVHGMPTAFEATAGTRGPVIAFLCEYDALAGLSQQAGVPERRETHAGGAGHGCGHNLLGAASAGAACALKAYADKTGLAVTVKCFGCPAEEDGGGKVFLARAGAFDHVDAAFTWHPGSANYVCGQGTLAVTGVMYRFAGRTAHAAAAPYAGRSALDACELMNVGCNYLREHIIPEARLHYAYRDSGPLAPNVVPDHACLHYYIRAPHVAEMMDIKRRVDDVARGAALMTGTQLTITEVDGFSDYVPNRALSELVQTVFEAVGAPAFSDEDRALAAQFRSTIPESERESNIANDCRASCRPRSYYGDKVLDDTVPPEPWEPHVAEPGSTDVGDVSQCAPTAQFYVATMALGTGGHTWQMTAQSGCEIGWKGMEKAAEIMALSGALAAADPELLARAKQELRETLPDGYFCPMPANARPEPPKD